MHCYNTALPPSTKRSGLLRSERRCGLKGWASFVWWAHVVCSWVWGCVVVRPTPVGCGRCGSLSLWFWLCTLRSLVSARTTSCPGVQLPIRDFSFLVRTCPTGSKVLFGRLLGIVGFRITSHHSGRGTENRELAARVVRDGALAGSALRVGLFTATSSGGEGVVRPTNDAAQLVGGFAPMFAGRRR